MWNPAGRSRRVLALTMAAAIAFVGSAAMSKAGDAVAQLTGGPTAGGRNGMLIAIVVVLAATGGLLLVLAGKELLAGHELHPARARSRWHR